MKVSQDITKRLDGILFGFYSAEEIRRMSAVEVKALSAFDQFGSPLKEGLYDPRMGVSPYERFARCVTCGQDEENCPGHLGHMELVVPVYNVFLVSYLHKIFRAKCLFCHKIKATDARTKHYRVMFSLLKFGFLAEFEEYKKLCEIRLPNKYKQTKEKAAAHKAVVRKDSGAKDSAKDSTRKSSQLTRRSSETSATTAEDKAKIALDEEAAMSEMLENLEKHSTQRRKEIADLLNVRKHPEKFENGFDWNSALAQKFHELVKTFLREMASVAKCPRCNNLQPSIKKEGYSKFFLTGVSDKTKVSKVLHSKEKMDGTETPDKIDSEVASVISDDKDAAKKPGQQILHPLEVVEHMKLMWQENGQLLNLIFGNYVCNKKTLAASGPGFKVIKFDPASFFIECLPVAPNRFRPENKMSDSTYLHPHTVLLQKILTTNYELKRLMLNSREKKEAFELKETFSKWIELQDAVNGLFDATKCGKVTVDGDAGIKQLLEKKEGMFRMKIMGKRVNYAARSVISPDPLLDTNEVGVPLFVAKKLTFPEAVNEANIDKLKTLIRNGPTTWPGAIYMSENGKKISFEGSTAEQRETIIKSLLANAEQKVVYRHIMNGDVLLFNRQPTLHKPSLMSHIARVLPREQTIRMHYANCSSYNADFDGDEMNLHLLQNHLARSEAYNLCLSDKQYIVATDNGPIRGLIQDIVLSAVFLTMKGSFFESSEYFQLIYSSLRTHLEKDGYIKRIKVVPPCIMKPRKLWSGKQIISTIINIIAEKNENDEFAEKLYMSNKVRINEKYLSKIDKEDARVVIQGNEMLTGILDKASIGESTFGLIHCFYELTDSKRTGKLLSGLSRLFSNYLQMHGFTCGLDDLMTGAEFENIRRNYLNDIHKSALVAQANLVGQKDFMVPEKLDLFGRPPFDKPPTKRLKDILKKTPDHDYLPQNNVISRGLEHKIMEDKSGVTEIDTLIKSTISQKHSEINDIAVTSGMRKNFPHNNFSVMVLSGAKGSVLNHTQISCTLGQQELEGKRVPMMASGKTLPSFVPFDPNIRAGGYIGDRFLTGLRTQEFFFHCMAGREGLIDTAVKTSRSGYLQRILVKNMESLIVQYDYTVRENDGSIIQFLYGEDCLDPTKVNWIEKIPFLADNYESFAQNTNISELRAKLNKDQARDWKIEAAKEPEKYITKTVMSELAPSLNFGSISTKAEKALDDFIRSDKRFNGDENTIQLNKNKFRNLFYAKYYESMAVPGESVGVTAGHSIGEPSTQMTLNTFHLAGHGGANMTLGVPRLRELLTTKNTSLPSMILEFSDKSLNRLEAKQIARQMQRVSLQELIKSINVVEQKNMLDQNNKPLAPEKRFRTYEIEFIFEDLKAIKFAFGIGKSNIDRILERIFRPRLAKTLMKILQKKQKQGDKKKGEAAEGVTAYDMENLKMRRFNEGGDNDREEVIPDQSEYEPLGNPDDDEVQNEDAKQIAASAPETNDEEDNEGLIRDFTFKGGRCTFNIRLSLNADKLLMLNIVEDVCKLVSVRELQGIRRVHLLEQKGKNGMEFKVQTEGVNFEACWSMLQINPHTIKCNDIHSIYSAYGIEAARNGLVKEVASVFDHYGIKVDFRHLFLIADTITLQGIINPMSRAGMQYNTSPSLKMSFETTMKFLTDACLFNNFDNLNTPSAKMVVGRTVQNGTGLFDVKYDFGYNDTEE